MPQLMPLYWNYSTMMMIFILIIMFNIYMWNNEMNWELNYKIYNKCIINIWMW